MHQCNVDPTGRILAISYSGVVSPGEIRQCLQTVRSLAETIKPGFILFTDLVHLENMDPECAPELGEIMEECAKMGLGASVRVVPSTKDIGLNLIARFHYPPEVRTQTHETLSEALNALITVFLASHRPQEV